MGHMMVDKTHLRFGRAEMVSELFESAILVGHAREHARHVQHVVIVDRELAFGESFQVVHDHLVRRGPARTHGAQLVGAHAGKIEAGANGVVGKSGVVLDTADAFLGHGVEQFTVAGDTCGRIVHLRIIKSEGDH